MLSANNASQLKSSDIVLKYNYQNGNSKDAAITATAASLKNTSDGQAKAGSGNKYAHSFELSNFDKFSVSGDKISISFILNMTGVAVEEFAENYYIEVCGINKDAFELLPGCSCNMTLKSGSDEPSKTDITVSSTFADKIDAEIKPSVEITFDNAINWSDVCTKYVTMTKDGDTAAIAYSAAYDSNKNVLTITPENNLAYGTKYTVSVSKSMPVPENYQIIEDYTFSFATVAESEYTLTVSKGTGIATVSEGGNYKADTEITLEYTLETGYEFDSWVSSEVTVDENNKFIMPSKDVNVTANAKIITYKISYDGLDGADEVTNPVTYDVTSATITLNNPTKENYDFIGWTGTGIDEGTASMTVTIPQGSTGNKTYTANWTPESYTITYNLDGGSLGEGVINPVSYDITSATITLNNPARGGCDDFLGWTGTGIEDGTASMTVTIPAGSTGDRAYTANWRTMESVMKFTLAPGIELEMRRCPAGSFVRSGRGGSYCDNKTVTISKGFYMGTYEVTNAQYAAIMGSSPSSPAGPGFTGDRQPVVFVSWDDIMKDSTGFISKLNAELTKTGQLPSGYKFALPTEAQWEYACRAGTTTDLNSGKDIENDEADEVACIWNNWGILNNKTHEVGGLASNSFGLYDMHGNVWEWCADWYGDYSSTDLTDPTGPAAGSDRVLRGGSWDYYGRGPFYYSSWYRAYCGPDCGCYDYGFRLALVPVQE